MKARNITMHIIDLIMTENLLFMIPPGNAAF